jgi:hypothetical protein
MRTKEEIDREIQSMEKERNSLIEEWKDMPIGSTSFQLYQRWIAIADGAIGALNWCKGD